jgi:uncharacterized protein with NRDE domain
MCLLLLALDSIPSRPWLLLANRDESHARTSAAAAAWPDHPDVLGGRDLVSGGSWLALNRNGRYAAVTNIRTGVPGNSAPRSRGALVSDFVAGAAAVADYTAQVAAHSEQYGPFNLVVGDAAGAGFVSSIDRAPRLLEPGVHAFSNGSLQDEWPKMRHLRAAFSALIARGSPGDAALLDLLRDTRQPSDTELPDTGVGLRLERTLAPVFIVGDAYGTRASTLAYVDGTGALTLIERRFGPGGQFSGETRIDVGQ